MDVIVMATDSACRESRRGETCPACLSYVQSTRQTVNRLFFSLLYLQYNFSDGVHCTGLHYQCDSVTPSTQCSFEVIINQKKTFGAWQDGWEVKFD